MKEQFSIAVWGVKRGLTMGVAALPIVAVLAYGHGVKEVCDQRGYSTSMCIDAARIGLRNTIKKAFFPSPGRYLAEDYQYRVTHPTPRIKGVTVTNTTLDMG